jgi:hypothetical protein
MNDDPARSGDEPFAGCWARLDRAREHIETFGTEWGRFLDPHPYRVYVDVQADGRGVVGIRRHEAMPAQLSLLIGEFLYELRAALDNCLLEIAIRHSGGNAEIPERCPERRADVDRIEELLAYLNG